MTDDAQGANPSGAQWLLDTYIKPGAAILSTVGTAVAAVFAILSERAASEAAREAIKISNEFEEQTQAREDRKIDNDYSLKIIDRVFESLEEGDVSNQLMILAIVRSMPDQQLSTDLSAALTASRDPGVKGMAEQVMGEADYAQTGDAPNSRSPSSPTSISVNSPLAELVARTQVLTDGQTANGGYDVDIFWCQGGSEPAQSSRYAAASRVAQTLNNLANSRTQTPPLGRVRLRPLPEATRNQRFTNLRGNEVRHEADEVAIGESVHRTIINSSGFSERITRRQLTNSVRTRHYISVFFCPA